MKSEDEIYIEIERYLQKKMDLEELKSFESQLAEDPMVAQKLQVQRLAQELILKNRLNQLSGYAKEIQQKEIKLQQYTKAAKIGIGILLAGLSAYYLIKPTQQALTVPPKSDSAVVILREPIAEAAPVAPQSLTNEPKQSAPKPAQKSISKASEEVPQYIDDVTRPIQEQVQIPEEANASNDAPIIEKSIVAPQKEVPGPCHQITLKAHIETFKTCAGESEGAVSVSRIQGGHKPYSIKLLAQSDHQEKALTGLEAGTYTVLVADSKSCTQVFENIVIGSKPCHIDHQFNPVLGETWELPSSQVPAELYIHDPSGHLVFQKHLAAMERITWDGKSHNGHLQSGIFVYLLKYADGTQQQGNITVLQ